MFIIMQKIGNWVFKFMIFTIIFWLFKLIFGQYFIALIYHINLSLYYEFGYYLNDITIIALTTSMIIIFSQIIFDRIKKYFLN